MKKIFCLMAMAVMLFTSCLKNEEPASLVELRQAKAALIAADAAYRTAEAALKQAEVEFQNALTAEQVLFNELQALENEAKAIENEIAKLDLEIKKAATEAKKAEWEAEKAKHEYNLLKKQQEMEELIENHKIAMLDLLAQVAQAELDYENALKLMEASKLKLTPEQQAIVDGYVAAIKALRYGGTYKDLAGKTQTVAKSISELRQALIEANANLQNAQFNWSAETALMQAELDSAKYATALEGAKKNLEDFIAFTKMENIQEWEAAAAEAEEAADEIEIEIDNVTVTLEALLDKNDPSDPDDDKGAIVDVKKEISDVDTEIGKVDELRYAEYINAFETEDPEPMSLIPLTTDKYYPESKKYVKEQAKLDAIKAFNEEKKEMAKEKVAASFEVPAEIAQVVANSINSVADDKVAFNDETKLYEFEDGKYTVEKELFAYTELEEKVYPTVDIDVWAKDQAFTEKSAGVIDVLKVIRNEIENDKEYVSGADLPATQEALAAAKADYAAIEKDFNLAKGYWEKVLEEMPAAVAAYKLEYNQDAQDDLIAAHNAYTQLVADLAAKVPAETPSDAQMTAYLANYAKYLKLREKLTGVTRTVMVDGKEEPLSAHLKVENWSEAGSLTPLFYDSDLTAIRTEATLTYGYTASVDYKDEDFAKEGLLPKWHHLSQELWGIDELRVSVDDYVGEDFRLVAEDEVANVGNVYNALVEVGYDETLSNPQDYSFDLTYYSSPVSCLWIDKINLDFFIKNAENVLANGPKYDELIADIDEIIVDLQEEVKGYSAESEGLVAELEKIDEEIEAIIEAADEMTEDAKADLNKTKAELIAELEALQDEYKKIDLQIQALTAEMGRLNDLASVYRGYIAKYYAAEAGVTLPTFANSEAIQAEFKSQIQAFEQEIIDATKDLNDKLEDLEQIKNGTDDDNVFFEQQLEKAKAEVEELEAEIEERLAEIEKYEELLKDTLAAFAGESSEGGEEA